jgi:kynurenine formamidase
MTDETTLWSLLATSRTIEIGHSLFNGMPSSPNHPGFKMALMRRHGDMVRADGSSASNEMIVTGGHVGTHVDALSHVSFGGRLHGGVDAAEAQTGGRFKVLGAEHTPPMLGRGLFFDIPQLHGVDRLEGGYGVTEDDLVRILQRESITPQAGDVAVVRPGWAQLWGDPVAYSGHDSGVPGISLSAARWLVKQGFRAVGADTTACECISPGAGHSLLPVHKMLLVDAGIHIIEHLALEDLAHENVVSFAIVIAPLSIVGGTGSPVRPLAVLPR